MAELIFRDTTHASFAAAIATTVFLFVCLLRALAVATLQRIDPQLPAAEAGIEVGPQPGGGAVEHRGRG